jgi:hypothetical protein
MKFIRIIKGGAGSGNFGHAGRPGEVGGSAPQQWFHASHAKIEKLSKREVETVDSIGTWVTADADKARTLYGPNVFEVETGAQNLLEAHTSNFNEFFFSNENLFKETFPKEPVALLQKFKERGLAQADPKAFSLRKRYLSAFRNMLEGAGYNGVVWRNSRIDLRKTDTPHDVAVIFNASDLKIRPKTT